MPTIQSITLSPTDDTYINQTAVTTNYGADTSLIIGSITNGSNFKISLIHFGGLSDGTIPRNAIITSAILYMYLTSTTNTTYDRSIDVCRMVRPWVANEATWNIASTGTNWGTAGANNITNDYNNLSIGNTPIGKTDLLNNYKAVYLDKSYIQDFVWGIWNNNGFRLDVAGGWSDEFTYTSVNNATSTIKPKLIVEYIVPTQLNKYRRDRQPGFITGI